MAKRKPKNNTVNISYYIESPTIRSHQRIKPHPIPEKHRTTSKSGYDRRAELLAYANELRGGDPQQVHWSRKSSNPKPKKWKLSVTPARIHVLFLRIIRGGKGRWKYERVVSEERITSRKKKKNSLRESSSHFWKKLKCMLKELPFAGKCNKGEQRQ